MARRCIDLAALIREREEVIAIGGKLEARLVLSFSTVVPMVAIMSRQGLLSDRRFVPSAQTSCYSITLIGDLWAQMYSEKELFGILPRFRRAGQERL
jgi:hypothetical protein